MSKKAFVSLFLLLLVSCGKKEQATSFCGSSVVNGKEVKENVTLEVSKNKCGVSLKMNGSFPSVVSLKTSHGLCTGTFINDHTILTAAHCFSDNFNVDSNGQVDVAVSIKEKKAVSTQVIINQKYFLEEKNYKYDQALIFVPKGTSKDSLELYEGAIEEKGQIYSVGFGNNKKENGRLVGSGKKRWGTNVIEEIKDNFIILDGTSINEKNGEDVSIGQGDSGGPLIYKNKVLGIASNIIIKERITSTYVKIDSVETKKFLKKALSLYNPNFKNNQDAFLKLCKNPKLKTNYYKNLMGKILTAYNLKKCEDLSYHYPLYRSLDLSSVDLKKINDDKLLDGIKLFKNLRLLKLNNTGLKSLDLFKKMKDLEELEIKNNPFEDFDSINHFKKLKTIQLDNKSILKDHPITGLNLQGKWLKKCHFSEDYKVYVIEESVFSSILTVTLNFFNDEKCTKKVVAMELSSNFKVRTKNENYSEIDLHLFHMKKIDFYEDGSKKEDEWPLNNRKYQIIKIKGNHLINGNSKGQNNDQRRLRPKSLNNNEHYLRVI
ncbi:trypsin-like serine protease [Bacteriovoracales bacterium]|nr:trypsin-like serine protease [Bacteriovoracales bacterium]